MERVGFDAELQKKLASKLYSFSQITKDTGISRYRLNHIKNNVQVPGYIIVALNEYFKKVS
jgi:hypothetical protein